MPNKPTASNPTTRVPKRNYVQDIADQDGYTRVLDETGTPMLMRAADPANKPVMPWDDKTPRPRAKVIGPKPNVQVASARG